MFQNTGVTAAFSDFYGFVLAITGLTQEGFAYIINCKEDTNEESVPTGMRKG
jgi:hypothetical protein